MKYVELTDEVIVENDLVAHVSTPESGAVLTFLGVVRNHHHGKAVSRLDYTAYGSMAVEQMNQIAETVLERWSVHRIALVHRLGTLEVGEASIGIAISLAHRQEGFDALRYVIDTFKEVVPIWKKEHFEDGVSEWVHQRA